MIIHDRHIVGRAAEYYVCYDLSKRGIRASISPFEQAPYDVLAEHNGRLITIQVKGTAAPYRTRHYRFTFFNQVEADLIAYVALDKETIHYRKVNKHKRATWILVDDMQSHDDKDLLDILDFTKSSPKKIIKPPKTLVDTSLLVQPRTD